MAQGKGISGNVVALTQQTQIVRIDSIIESTGLLRTEYPEEPLLELGDSLLEKGLLQPIIVQPSEDDGLYELVIGSRRMRAARLKGIESISAFVIDRQTPLEVLLLALTENLHRTDLNPFEEAAAFLRLMREFSLDLRTASKRTGKTESYISTRLALLSMPDDVQELVATKKLGIQFVKPLARVASGADQARLALGAVANRFTVEELQAQVRREREDPEPVRVGLDTLTPQKLRAKLDSFAQWLKKAPAKLDVGKMNADERFGLNQSCILMESQLRDLREFIGNVDFQRKATASLRTSKKGNLSRPSNYGQEWPSGHISRIHAKNRPPDEVLAKELGRTVAAIRGMRNKSQ